MSVKKVFINKYDYLRSYSRCEQVNFLKNAEIEAVITNTLNNFKAQKDVMDDEDDEDFEDDNYDSYEEYRISKLNLDVIDLNSLDVDKKKETDPKIIEGTIIDKKAKAFIAQTYNVDVVIDYDDKQYQDLWFDNEKAALQTQNDINKLKQAKQSFILFQPTFINETINHSLYVTKCDAIVYLSEDECILVEVKGTTSSKIIHLLDFLFQQFVLLSENNSISITKFQLCLAKYCRAKKNEIPFILSETINLTKTAPQLTKKQKQELELTSEEQQIAIKQRYKLGRDQLSINGVLTQTLSEEEVIENIQNTSSGSEKSQINKATRIINNANLVSEGLSQEFEARIDVLFERKKINNKLINLKPCSECKGPYKNCEYWLKCRELFKLEYKKDNKTLEPFIYSGNIIGFANQLGYYENYGKGGTKIADIISDKYKFFAEHENKIDWVNARKKLALLMQKKDRVYFDFESINTAIRPMDNVFPFNQVITQNSIIKTNNYYDEYFCIDMIIDPKNIDIEWIKAIIDNLIVQEDAWYIVYNKNFECTRLKEMAKLINEKEYYDKVKHINDNIFDLADFFNPHENLILLDELHGFYSIKKVLELIPKEILDETKTKSYHDLEVYNGAVAQEVTTKRFFDLVSDEEWTHIAKELQTYCQNDVRAMIAVEKLITSILKETN